MLQLFDLSKSLDKETYERLFPDMEIRLGQCQRRIRHEGARAVVVFEGWDAAGKGTLINRVTQALDPRGFRVHPIVSASGGEAFRPWMWQFWLHLPQDGNLAFFDQSWYGRVLADRINGTVKGKRLERAYSDIEAFERQLTDDGVIIVKFWLHIDAETQRKRFKALESNGATAWKVGEAEREQNKRYDAWHPVVDEMLERTSSEWSPWVVVESLDARFARFKVFETLIGAIDGELDRRRKHPKPKPRPMPKPKDSPTRRATILDKLDLNLAIGRADYDKEMDKLKERLFQLEHELFVARIPALVVYEGVDAGGKGGNIRRLTRGMDPRGYEVVPVIAPTREELANHYLRRFWTRLPKAGHITIFDRSWYGRVLVERVEGFCNEDEWKRAYREINEFERQITDFGTVLVKFWLHIDQKEQIRRFKSREETPHKQWKMTDEDWRNRRKWPQYSMAVVDMLKKTSSTYAPWTIVEANDKLYARIKTLSTVANALDKALRERDGRQKAQ